MLRRIAIGLAVLVALPLFTFISAQPASAASYPLCTKVVNHRNGIGQNMAVPASSRGVQDCLIGDGNEGCGGANCAAIKRLQRTINVCYLGPRGLTLLKVDGWWGPKTKAALIKVQGWEGAAKDGVYGPETKRKMRHESNDIPFQCRNY